LLFGLVMTGVVGEAAEGAETIRRFELIDGGGQDDEISDR